MRVLGALALMGLLFGAVPAPAETMAMQLHAAINQACGNCITGVSTDGTIWYQPSATAQQQSRAQAAFQAFNQTQAQAATNAQATERAGLTTGISVSCAPGAMVCTSGIAGTYKADSESQLLITAEMVSILTNNTFTNGQTTRAWADASGGVHTFTVPQWKEFATAVGVFVDGEMMALQTAQQGGTPSWPSANVTLN